jgi:L-ribulose-5-phosphate 3-epimerase
MTVPEVGVFLSTSRIPNVADALAAVQTLGFRAVQLGKLADSAYSAAGVRDLARLLQQHGLVASSLCIVYDGESYANIDAVYRTVGLLPPETVADRVAYSQRCVNAAVDLGITLVTFHIGMLPADPADPGYQRIQDAVDQIAANAAKRGVKIGLETGQETAVELLAFIARLATPVGVNFDGANFIAYGTADPVAALEVLYPQIIGVHIKDYALPAAPGLLSRSAPLGQGAARVDDTVRYLLNAGFAGPLILETYDSVNPLQTLAEARAYLTDLVPAIATSETNGGH